MSDPGHIVQSFDEELQNLGNKIAQMGGMAERALSDAVGALVRRDMELAGRVIAGDAGMDALERQVEEEAVLTIARRQPMAVDLREIVAAIRIASDLERIGDLAKNIAKRTTAIGSERQPHTVSLGVEHMTDLVLEQMKNVLDAYVARDAARALSVRSRDEAVDALYTSLFRELLTYMMEDPRNITICTHLLFCAKNIERAGDHATNIAENVHFLVTGELPEGERPKGDTSSLTPAAFPPAASG